MQIFNSYTQVAPYVVESICSYILAVAVRCRVHACGIVELGAAIRCTDEEIIGEGVLQAGCPAGSARCFQLARRALARHQVVVFDAEFVAVVPYALAIGLMTEE